MRAATIGRLCRDALLAEVNATPKPGLVDQNNNGAHHDMDRALFHKSAAALLPYFTAVAQAGINSASLPPSAAFRTLRPLGVDAEARMLQATGGVNTHKGAVFSLGLLAAATGRLLHGGEALCADAIAKSASMYVAGICAAELHTNKQPATKGELAFFRYGLTGVRGEAEAGFPAVLQVGLPAYRRARRQHASKNDALVEALLHLMQAVPDTNVLGRAGPQAAQGLQARAAAFLKSGYPTGSAPWKAALLELDAWCIEAHISPGGCADLAACVYYLTGCTAQ